MDTIKSNITDILPSETIEASAPCRIDMGGTLDISSFYYPLAYLDPCTFNIALAMRTRVRITPFQKGYIKISSRGFESTEFPIDKMPFDHPMGLMFAIAGYFQVDGIHIIIESGSPPRSALGGSSVAAVALIEAFNQLFQKAGGQSVPRERIALLAHGIEESVAGVPCGLQDQLAAVYGGINAWNWRGAGSDQPYVQRRIVDPMQYVDISRHLLLAYCGIPHESKNINSTWVRQFITGECRSQWVEIARCVRGFVSAFAAQDMDEAVKHLNRETAIRMALTPDVLDETGLRLVNAAVDHQCGGRFTGAGGGGCIWALGQAEKIGDLKNVWKDILRPIDDAALLDVEIDGKGLTTGPE